MNYYYDVLLNFQEDYYMFYEWDEIDNLEYIKKIPLFHVDTKMIIDTISGKIKINLNDLKKIENKTKLKDNKFLSFACIISDGKNSVALEFDESGININKSSLITDDELNINEFIYSINKSVINYEVLHKIERNKELRQELKIKRILKLELDNMLENKNYSKLKYIYLEWFQEILNNVDDMYINMINKLNSNLTDKEYHIYEIIKMSYNNV